MEAVTRHLEHYNRKLGPCTWISRNRAKARYLPTGSATCIFEMQTGTGFFPNSGAGFTHFHRAHQYTFAREPTRALEEKCHRWTPFTGWPMPVKATRSLKKCSICARGSASKSWILSMHSLLYSHHISELPKS